MMIFIYIANQPKIFVWSADLLAIGMRTWDSDIILW